MGRAPHAAFTSINPKVTFRSAAAMLNIEDANCGGSGGVPEMRVGTAWVGLPALQPCASTWLRETFRKSFPARRRLSGPSVRRFHGNRDRRFLECEPLAVHCIYKFTSNGFFFARRAECARQRYPDKTARARISVSVRRFAICPMVSDFDRLARQRASLRCR